MEVRPSTFWYCSISVTLSSFSNMCSTLFILSMTFERLYSIIKPHKAALFNTIKRAQATIVIVVIVSVIFNIPHLFATSETLGECMPIGKGINYIYGQIYSWLTSLLNFFLQFVLLLVMNIVIIHTLRTRTQLSESQG